MKAETIRCRALMVGDWCCDKHGFQMQITNVGDDYAYATFEGNEGALGSLTTKMTSHSLLR